LGAGPGQFADAFLTHNFPAGIGVVNYWIRTDHAHSEVMEAAVDFGVPGLLFLLAALWASLRPPTPERSSWTQEAGLAAFAGMSAQCLIDNMLQLPALSLLYVSALAVAWEPASEPALAERSVWRALAWAGLLLAAVSWAPAWFVQGWQASAARAAEPGPRLALLLRATRLAPADPYLRESLYGAWLAQKPPQVDEALDQISQAESLSPFNAVYPAWHASLLRSRGDWPRVLESAGRAISLEPDYLQARLARAEALLRLDRLEEARGELLEIGRRSAAREALLNGRIGYEGCILGFDRAGYEDLMRRAKVPVDGPGPRSD
jgi:tetratricopeptide (TPR) repeat protein